MKITKLLGLRKERGINQADLAKDLKLCVQTLSDLECGRLGVDLKTYDMILRAIDKLTPAAGSAGIDTPSADEDPEEVHENG
ncbi:MAG: helix-turn-helix transcriptional regulator [Capsulimonadaceae bacterium]|nr:helix-turn-helix transcriptional regulator [Capsulimonadaceae bacterium]